MATTSVLIAVLTAALIGWIALVWWARRSALAWLTLVIQERTKVISSRVLRRVSFRHLLQLSGLAVRLGSVMLMLCGFVAWVLLLFGLFPGTRSWATRVEDLIIDQLAELGQSALAALPQLAVVAVVFFATHVVHELLKHFFQSIAQGEVESQLFDAVTAETTRRLAGVGIWLCAIIIAFPYLPGSESAAFRGVTVLAGLMFSIGSANLVTQFTSGLALIYGRAVRPGDYIETSQAEGVVEHVGLLSCTLRTVRDEVVVLPNSVVAGGVKNFSCARIGVRFAASVSIGYDTPWRKVRDLLLAAAAATPGVRSDPAPLVRQVALEDFSVRYNLLFTPLDPAERIPILGRLHEAIQDQFQEAGIQIMSPHYEADPATPKVPVPSTGTVAPVDASITLPARATSGVPQSN